MADRSFLHWPFFLARHRELAAKLDEWAASELVAVDETDVDTACRHLVVQLAKGGWLGHAAPEGGFDVRTLCLIREALAYHSGLADFAFALQGLGSAPIRLVGSEALKDAYLPAVREGKKIAAFALTEPEAGSDVAAIATTAKQDGDHFVLSGEKTWISNGGIADFYVVFARSSDEPGVKGLSAFVVDAATKGLEIAERLDVIAPHPLARLEFKNCKVPVSHMLGQPGDGFKIAMSTLDVFRPSVGAAALGFARRALDETLRQTNRRQIYGGPLSEMPTTQERLAEMATRIDAAALLVYRAAWTKDTGAERITREAAMAKLFATEASQEVIDMAVQLHGALGVASGSTVERLYREIRALRIYEGASEVQRQIIARQVLKEFES
jgi:acyl-CoA dehydrogenase